MKVIDLLNKIANGEEVHFYVINKGFKIEYFYEKGKPLRYEDNEDVEWRISKDWLNCEVEIIEKDKKIEKLDVALLGQSDNWIHKYNIEKKEFESLKEEINPYIIDTIRENTIVFQKRINEIIDYLEEKDNE